MRRYNGASWVGFLSDRAAGSRSPLARSPLAILRSVQQEPFPLRTQTLRASVRESQQFRPVRVCAFGVRPVFPEPAAPLCACARPAVYFPRSIVANCSRANSRSPSSVSVPVLICGNERYQTCHHRSPASGLRLCGKPQIAPERRTSIDFVILPRRGLVVNPIKSTLHATSKRL